MSEFVASYATYVGAHLTRAKLQIFSVDITG